MTAKQSKTKGRRNGGRGHGRPVRIDQAHNEARIVHRESSRSEGLADQGRDQDHDKHPPCLTLKSFRALTPRNGRFLRGTNV